MKRINKIITLVPALALLASCSIVGDIIGDVLESGILGGETSEVFTDTLKSQSDVKKKLGNTYEFKMEIKGSDSDGASEQGTYVYARNEEYIYTALQESSDEEEAAMLFKASGNNSYLIYNYEDDEDVYSSATLFTDGDAALEPSWLFLTSDSIEYTSKKSTTFLGRPCTEYVVEENITTIGVSVSSSYTYVIDNEIGICFKMASRAKGRGGVEEAWEEASLTVTEFSQNASKVQEALKAETDKITINQWDKALFTRIGLNASNIAAPNGIWQYGSISDSSYVVMYTLGNTYAESLEIMQTVMNSFFQAGANMNSDYEVVSSTNDQSYSCDESEEYATYYGYWEHDGYYEVDISLARDYDSSFYLTVTIDF